MIASLRNMPTIATVLRDTKGVGPGFDALRIGLAVAIMLWHSVYITHGRQYFNVDQSPVRPFIIALVPAFFCLSGFLVTGSAFRLHSVRTFLTFRGLRIFPALIVEVILCAIILGPLVTALPLEEYFTGKQFYSYFGNIVGRVRFNLPGVFGDNPLPDVINGSLWTLQPEFYCYLLMAACMATGWVYDRRKYTIAFGVMTVALVLVDFVYQIGRPDPLVPWPSIVYSFFVGVLFFHWKDKIPVNGLFVAISVILAYVTLDTDGLTYIASLPLTYCIVFFGMVRIPLPELLRSGDYSYGIYLFGYPIQQSTIHFIPAIENYLVLFLISITITMVFAVISWHFVEKRAIKLKKYLLSKPSGLGNSLSPAVAKAE